MAEEKAQKEEDDQQNKMKQ